jgi:hypothetical protein
VQIHDRDRLVANVVFNRATPIAPMCHSGSGEVKTITLHGHLL